MQKKKASPKKRYRVSLTLPDGTRKFYSGSTLKEAEGKRDKDKLLIGRGIDVKDTTTLKTLAETWFDTYKSDTSLHKRTVETTSGILYRYIIPVLGDMVVSKIKPVNIDQLMNKWAHLSNSTQKKILQITRSLFVMAIDNELISKSPVSDRKRAKGTPTKEVQPLTDEQCDTLLNSTKGTRVWLFLMVLRYAGLRKGEAIGLMWKDIDFDAGTIHVQRSVVYPLGNRSGEINDECKTDSANRIIPIPDILLDALRDEYRTSGTLYVFTMESGRFMSESSFRRMWDLIRYRSINSPHKRHYVVSTDISFDVHPHMLRHTYATKLIQNGITPKEAQYLLGHASPDITMKIYVHYQVEQQLVQTSKKISNIFDGNDIVQRKRLQAVTI